MPRIAYEDYNPRGDARIVIQRANAILEEYAEQGFQLTLRQLYYQFVSRDFLGNSQRNYNKLGTIITKARDAGMVDWDHIEDRGRTVNSYPHWEDAKDFVESVMPQFRIDLWRDQPFHVEVWVEKDALVDVIGQACRPLDVPYFANKGYLSASAAWDAGHNRFRRAGFRGQDVIVFHLGDHDPSGIQMTDDIRMRMSRYSRLTEDEEAGGFAEAEIQIRRLALNMLQIENAASEMGRELPPNPAKMDDPRAADYVARFGRQSWELDALEPNYIVQLVQENVRAVMDEERFAAAEARQLQQREQLSGIADHWEAVVEFLGEL